ncbi:MAG: glycosyltransferase involved in cell wall biosynthesis [Paraglaciecola sp.]|jgi:glycosyltransferase involved in cell wall biosynthesis
MYGANKSLLQLIIELRRDFGIKPIVLLPRAGEICKEFEKEKIEFQISHFYWWVNNNQGIFQKVLNVRKQIRNQFRVKQICKLFCYENIDLVYSNSVTINMGVFISRKLHCPHIWHIRETMEAYNFRYSLGKWFAKKHFQKPTNRYILISDFLFRSYSNCIPSNKITRIYNGVNGIELHRKENQFEGVLKLCMVGVISEQKNQLDILKAIKILVEEYQITNIHLHIIGTAKGDYLEGIQNFIAANHLTRFISFHGHQSNVSEWLSKMNLGIMCSRDEAFGRVTIEYMLHRLPVIASNSGANPELIVPGNNGEIYELYNAQDLANKIMTFVNNPDLLEEYGRYAQEFAAENFSSKQNSENIYKTIKEIIPLNSKK